MMEMHDEHFGSSGVHGASANGSGMSDQSNHTKSLYIERVKTAIAICHDVYFRSASQSVIVQVYIAQFSNAILSLFVKHAALLKPFSKVQFNSQT